MAGDRSGSPLYRLLLWCARLSWLSASVGVAAMVPAMVLRSEAFVDVFRVGLVLALGTLAAAAVVFVGLVASPRRFDAHVRAPEQDRRARRADVLLALLVMDLLDPDPGG